LVLFAKYNENNEVEEDEMGEHAARIGEKRNAYRLLVRKPEVKRPLGRPRRRWLDNIKQNPVHITQSHLYKILPNIIQPRRRWLDNIRKNLVEVGWGDVDWIGLAQDRDRLRALVNSILNLRVP
jgi:hypothetical protein